MRDRVRAVLAVALADCKQRSRSRKLLVVPVLVAYFVKLVTVDTTLVVAESYTGVPTAAWFGGMTTVIGTTVFLLFGFAFVRGGITRDRESGTGALVASSPVSNPAYLLGKWLSNLLVLGFATGVLLLATAVAFLLQGTGGFAPWAFLSPFLLITLPTMAVVAAAAVCFEATRLLRGTAGTVVYFVAALVVFTAGIAPDAPLDLTGITLVRDSMARAIAAQYPAFDGSAFGFAYTDAPGAARQFAWTGITWTGARLATRLPVAGLAAGLLAVAAVTFDRFDGSDRWSLPAWGGSPDETATEESAERRRSSPAPGTVDLDLAPVDRGGFAVGRVLLAELRMALRGHPRWWYAACAAAIVAVGVAPLDAVRTLVVPTALLLPLSAWSALGAREQRHRTEELVLVGGRPGRLLGATYAAGVLVGLLVTFPAPVRFGLAGLYGPLVGWAVGVLALPAVGLAMGVWTGRPKLFETVYLVAWYLGPVNGLAALDYLGGRSTTVRGVTVAYLAIGALALGAAYLGRRDR